MIRPSYETENQAPLVDTLLRFDELSEEITQNIEILKGNIENLNEFKSKMGSQDDTRTLRRRLTHEINKGNDNIKKTTELLKEFGDFKFRRKKDIENYNKMTRRLNHSFEEHHEAFTKILKEVHSKEKIFLELRRSMTLNASNSSESITITSDANGSQLDLEGQETFEEACNNFEFIASIIEERQTQKDNKKKSENLGAMNRNQEQTRDLESSNAAINGDDSRDEVSVRIRRTQKKNFLRAAIIIILILASLASVGVIVYSFVGF